MGLPGLHKWACLSLPDLLANGAIPENRVLSQRPSRWAFPLPHSSLAPPSPCIRMPQGCPASVLET